MARIVLVVTGFPSSKQPHRGVFNLRSAKALAQGVDLRVIHLRTWKPGRAFFEAEEVDGLQVYRVALIQMPLLWASGRLVRFNTVLGQLLGLRLVRRVLAHCDIIHSVGAVTAGLIASGWARKLQLKQVVQLVGSDVNMFLQLLAGSACEAQWKRRIDAVVCNSAQLEKEFRALYPDIQDVRTVYRGVDAARFSPDGPAAGPLANRSPVRFLFAGGFPNYRGSQFGHNIKGGQDLLNAWAAAEDELSVAGASILIAGPNSDCDSLWKWRSRLRFPDHVHLAGIIAPELMPAYLRSADVLLAPSRQEGLPNVIMEANASGVPAFGSKVGGIPELIVPDETGLILPPGEITVWERTMVTYANRLGPLRRMGAKARNRMLTFFNSDDYGRAMLQIYESLRPAAIARV